MSGRVRCCSSTPAFRSSRSARATPTSRVCGAVTVWRRWTGGPADHPFSRPLVEPGRVVPEELLLRLLPEARPRQDVVDELGELALRVRIVGAPHQDVVAEHAPD